MPRLWPTAGFAACALISIALLTAALREVEVGAAYAVWTRIGASGGWRHLSVSLRAAWMSALFAVI